MNLIDKHRHNKKQELRRAYRDVINKGFSISINGKTFVIGNKESISDYSMLAKEATLSQKETVHIREVNDKFTSISLVELNTLIGEALKLGVQKYEILVQKENLVNEKTDIEEILAINWQ